MSSKKSKFQAFDMQEVHRSEIKSAPYNPRIINDGAKKRLRSFLSKHGLVCPLTWNKTTGNLVSGHQRLDALDMLEGTNDYILNVAVIEVSEREEKKLNVQMNNPSMQGDWNVDMLNELVFGDEIGPDEMGFSLADSSVLFGSDERFVEMFKDTPDAEEAKENIKKVKEHREEAAKKMQQEQSADFYFIVVCANDGQKKKLMQRLETPTWEQYVDGDVLASLIL